LGRVISEVDASGNKRRTFVYKGNQLVATQMATGVWWQHTDASGTSIRNTSQTGTVVNQIENEPLGGKANQEVPDSTPDPVIRVRPEDASMGCQLDGGDVPCSVALNALQGDAGRVEDPHAELDRAVAWAKGRMILDMLKKPIFHPDANQLYAAFGFADTFKLGVLDQDPQKIPYDPDPCPPSGIDKYGTPCDDNVIVTMKIVNSVADPDIRKLLLWRMYLQSLSPEDRDLETLKDCYKRALQAYDSADNQTINFIEDLNPVNKKFFTPERLFLDLHTYKALTGGGSSKSTRFTKEVVNTTETWFRKTTTTTTTTVVTTTAEEGLTLSKVVGAASLGLSIGGFGIEVLDHFIGRDKALKDMVNDCNISHQKSPRHINTGFMGIGLADDIRAFH
jgi:hypothetical protein